MFNDEIQLEKTLQAKGLNAPRLTPEYINSIISSIHFFTAYEGTQGNELEYRRKNTDKPLEVSPYKSCEHSKNNPLLALTFCVLVLKNGFTVTGESACASPENFDAAVGREVAYKNAREKIWELEGYLLRDKLHSEGH